VGLWDAKPQCGECARKGINIVARPRMRSVIDTSGAVVESASSRRMAVTLCQRGGA